MLSHSPQSSSRPTGLRRRVLGAVVGVIAMVCVLGACAQPSGNDDTANAGYVSGDGSVKVWAQAERGAPVSFSGLDFAGNEVDVASWRGTVVVLNTWYAACPPCRKEAPVLVDAAATYAPQVQFLGINSTDDAGAAQAFERTFEVPYPSIADVSGDVIAALQGVVPIQATPTTVILDPEGRVAARVLGEIPASTLSSLLDDVLAEQGAPAVSSSTGSSTGTAS